MLPFSLLNTPGTIEFEDLRLPGIKTNVPRGIDIDFTETASVFNIYRKVDIEEIIQPQLLNLRYQIDLTTQVEGAIPVVNFGTLPSGVTLFSTPNTYIISGIDTLAKWNAVKDPEIQINDFLGNFSYTVKIIFFNGTADQEIRWTVGTYVPAGLLEGEFTQTTSINRFRNITVTLTASTSLTALPFEIFPIQLDAMTITATASMVTEGQEVKTATANLNSVASISIEATRIGNITLSELHVISPTNDIVQSGVDNDDIYSIVGSVGTNTIMVYNNSTGTLNRTINRPNSDFDRLGWKVSLQGNTITASHDYLAGGTDKPVYQFNLTNGNLIRTINSPGTSITFGLSLDTSSLYTIVGTGVGAGNDAYVYENSTGNLLYTLSVAGQKLTTCSISNTRAVVVSSDQIAYVYNMANGALLHTIPNPNTNTSDTSDNFGSSIDINDDYLVIGAANENFGTTTDGLDSGVVYVFDLNQSAALVRTLLNPNAGGTRRNDRFGSDLKINNNYLIVGAFQEDVVGDFLTNTNRGAAYTFNLTTGNLMQTIVGTEDFRGYGWRVSLSNNYAAVNNLSPGATNTQFRIYTVSD
jgi:hypothetical protein